MPWLTRANPETACQPDGAHHPHRLVCDDTECDCVLDLGEPFNSLVCCVCRWEWPCPTKKEHEKERHAVSAP